MSPRIRERIITLLVINSKSEAPVHLCACACQALTSAVYSNECMRFPTYKCDEARKCVPSVTGSFETREDNEEGCPPGT